MSINGIAKAGYFLLGVGIGIFGTTLVMKRELEKPIGEVEEYIPLEDRENFGEDFDNSTEDCSEDKSSDNIHSRNSNNSQKDIPTQRRNSRRERRQSERNDREERNTEFSSNQSDILNYYKSSSKDATRAQNRYEKDKRREEFDRMREERSRNQKTRYSKIYKDEDVAQAIHDANSGRESTDSYSRYVDDVDDGPIDDYIVEQVYDEDIHENYTLERVDENIEIFLNDNPQDFITMIFYEGDNTLCDDGEQIVPNADEVIGYEALSRLIQGGPGAENGVIFVHNLKTSLNYEVVLDAGYYQDTVIGQFESHLNGDGVRGGSS